MQYQRILTGIVVALLVSCSLPAQQRLSTVWVADQGDGTYKNPVIYADYSDPDAIRVGEDYYMISSSFNHVPGIPILHSHDLVNWELIGHVFQQQRPLEHFSKVQHGNGAWAPSIRYHKGEFVIYYPDPDFGIYVTRAKNIKGPWSMPVLVQAGKGLIDPCPFWDDDGHAYLVHAFAGSRAGIKSIVVIKRLNAEGTAVVDNGVLVYDGHEKDPTIEGPKLYKRNGWYYIFAPAGGVPTGWQLVLRSKNIYGPYERKVVMDQGRSPVNGPHQGAWVETPTGESWFLHFQDQGAYGRVVHLQPMKWVNNWPVIGMDSDGDGKGEPVLHYKKPGVGKSYPRKTIADSDEFATPTLGLQWQWQANPDVSWAFPDVANGQLVLFSQPMPGNALNYWNVANLLLQKFPAEEFQVTTRVHFQPRWPGERAGLIIFGTDYASLTLVNDTTGIRLVMARCLNADKGSIEQEEEKVTVTGNTVVLRAAISAGGIVNFYYSIDNQLFIKIGQPFVARPGRWVGAKMGLFCTRPTGGNDAGLARFDWFRVEPVPQAAD